MAETFVFGIAAKILWLLGSPALKEIGFLWGLNDELQKLQNSVSTIKAVLLDAEEKQTRNHEVRDWLEKIEDVFYEADNLLDDLSTEALKRREKSGTKRGKQVLSIFSRSYQLNFNFKLGQKVKVIQKRLDAIAADRTFHLNERQEEIRVASRQREEHSFAGTGKIIGREKEKKDIIDLLLEPRTEENLAVVSVVGIGGVGKTALAQLAYNDEKVKNHFDLRIWVCVSHVFDVESISRGIIESVSGKKCKKTRLDGVKDELKDQIDGKRYFLVLDDVWNEDPNIWLKLKELLTGGVGGSVILVTTRSQLVAKVMATVSVTPYILNGLSEDESWSLFQQMVFSDGVKRQNPGLIEVGKEIVRKCSGIPLAIRNVGSLLFINDTEKEWLHFKDNKLSKIADTKSSIFSILSSIFSILKLSYDYLPLHLKRCFAYCSLFPKGHNIDKLVLIQLWIAQGLIQPSDENKSMEDVGEQYFLDLFRRSFLQDVAQDELGFITICKVHDLIHELSELVAGSENCLVGLDAKGVVARTRHVSFGFVLDSSWNIPTQLLYANQLRTLLFPVQKRKFYSECMDKVVCHEVISSFKCLRALDLHQMGMRTVPSTIRDLRHLRFLDLSFNYFRFLPKSICKLLNLQTLKLNRCHNLEELPSKTQNLVSLRHLELDGCVNLSSMPQGIERLTSLQTLTRFIVGSKSSSSIRSAGLRELISLVNLRGRLSIERLRGSVVETSESDQSCFYVKQMEHLQFLILKWDDRRAVTDQMCNGVGDDYDLALFERLCPNKNLKKLQIENYGGVSFPCWVNKVNIGFSLPNVVEISVSLCHRCQHLPPFDLLPSLQVLSIFSMDSLEYIYEDDEEIWSFKKRELFPSLKKLHLSDLKMLKGIGRKTRRKELPSTCSSGSMRSLISLHISYCPCIDLLSNNDDNSFFLHNLGSLTVLYISSMPKLKCLPLGLQYLTKLESLFVTHCESLVAFSDVIEKLESLQLLLVHNCESLTSLPDSLIRLAALKELAITGCPQLVARCQKETGKDWPKIAHIPCIKVED